MRDRQRTRIHRRKKKFRNGKGKKASFGGCVNLATGEAKNRIRKKGWKGKWARKERKKWGGNFLFGKIRFTGEKRQGNSTGMPHRRGEGQRRAAIYGQLFKKMKKKLLSTRDAQGEKAKEKQPETGASTQKKKRTDDMCVGRLRWESVNCKRVTERGKEKRDAKSETKKSIKRLEKDVKTLRGRKRGGEKLLSSRLGAIEKRLEGQDKCKKQATTRFQR